MSTTTSVLESEYIVPTRPYSQNELAYLRERLYRHVRLGNMKTQHNKCRHFYFAKENSRKEKEMTEKGTQVDVGNCSVCWKLHKTPRHLRSRAEGLTEAYTSTFHEDPKKYDYELLDLETIFYKWLYHDNYKN